MATDITSIIVNMSDGFAYRIELRSGAQLKDGQVIAIAVDKDLGRPFAAKVPGDGIHVSAA